MYLVHEKVGLGGSMKVEGQKFGKNVPEERNSKSLVSAGMGKGNIMKSSWKWAYSSSTISN
jgi:hypothetical protein